MTDFPDPAPGRPLWLITLADLALLLVGYLVLVQSAGHDGQALANGLRGGFGVGAVEEAAPLPVAAAGIDDFATGSAIVRIAPDAVIAWARAALKDPRVSLTVTGSVDGTAADVDPATRSAAILAADRGRTVAAMLAPIARGRLVITTSLTPGRRSAMVTLAFTGAPPLARQPRKPS